MAHPFPWTRLVGALLWGAACVCAQVEVPGVDGSGNHPEGWGVSGERALRVAPAAYGDGLGSLRSDLPNPRAISNAVFAQAADLPDTHGRSSFVWAWGQFIAHDLTHVLLEPYSPLANINIPVPAGDPVFTPGLFFVTRSVADPSTGTGIENPRTQINNLSAFLDGTVLYGGQADENGGTARLEWMREGEGGRLLMTDTAHGPMLPRQDAKPQGPGMAEEDKTLGVPFIAGDVRANENPVLLSLHTLFAREHNRLAQWIDTHHADLPLERTARDEALFQRARLLLMAELQAITYNEFLPALGIGLPAYQGYDPEGHPGITLEFLTAAFRLGHTMVVDELLHCGPDGFPTEYGNPGLFDVFFRPDELLEAGGIDGFLRGLASQRMQEVDAHIVASLRDLLFTDGETTPVINGTDLAALNIQRGRDHGLPGLNGVRRAMGLPAYTSFAELAMDTRTAEALASIYEDVEDVDLWVGILAEIKQPGAILGETGVVLWQEQFTRLRDHDRFYYKNLPVLDEWAAPAPDAPAGMTARQWLDQLRPSEIILRNTRIDRIQDSVFFSRGEFGQLFAEARLVEGVFLIDSWMGDLYVEHFPWFYDPDSGWYFYGGYDAESTWLFKPEKGWVWTARGVYPLVWHADTFEWILVGG